MKGVRCFLAWTALAVLAVVLGPFGATAHVRLRNPSNDAPLFWQNPESIGIVIGSKGSDDIDDGSHETSIRAAIDAWNGITATTMRLVEDASPEEQAREDWESDDVHLFYFDEDNSSGYFPPGSATVAITPVWFFSSGKISDADVLFNGSGFQFTTKTEPGRFDVEDVAAHELGHLLGLDHSGWAGGTMYPFVDPSVILHRSLSLDEIAGIRDVYPDVPFGVLRGRVLRDADSTPVAGAHVVARTAGGRTAGGTLTDPDGVFLLRGLEAGGYEVYATPLDEPVSAANLTGGHEVDVDFESMVHPAPVELEDGATTDLGDLFVGPDIALNLGRSYDRYPRRVIAGLSSWIIIRGTGLVHGSTLEASDPEVTVVPLDWVGFQVNFQVIVPADAAPGHVDLTVTDPSGHISILPAALEVTPPSPVVSSVTPALGGMSGGTLVDVRGSGFLPGCRVVVGDHIYLEGRDDDVELVDPGYLRLTLRETVTGVHDVVVVDESGVEGRMAEAMEVAPVPRVDAVFPKVGAVTGGTRVVVSGADFLEGAQVALGGTLQDDVQWIGSTQLEVVTGPGAPDGGPLAVEVVNPGGYEAALAEAFAYVAQPDPVLDEVFPAEGKEDGDDEVELRGENFGESAVVLFGVDPTTGEGGVPAPQVEFVDGGLLRVVTPAHPVGEVGVAVRDPGTGQQALLAGGFTYEESRSGGGCAAVVPAPGPKGPLRGWTSALWMLALALVLALRSRRRRPARA